MNINYISGLIKDLKIESDAFSDDFSLILLSQILAHVSEELNKFYDLGVKISSIVDDSESMLLFMDISGFLREYGCPYSTLMEGPLDSRFRSDLSLELLLTFLLTELMAAQVNATQRSDCTCLAKPNASKSESNNLTALLKPTLILLRISKPPENLTLELFFGKFEQMLNKSISTVPKYFIGKSLMESIKPLNEQQWKKVDSIINTLNDDHHLRRQTLIQRFDVTVQSLKWSPKANSQLDNITKAYYAARAEMESKHQITLIDLLSARDYPLALIVKTCGSAVRERTRCKLNRMIIGAVGDRGGRPFEMEAPPPELPAFQKREGPTQSDNSRDGGSFHNRGRPSDRRGRQDRGRGGSFNQDRGGNFNQGRGGGYNQGRGGGGEGHYNQDRGGGGGGGNYNQDRGGGGGNYNKNYQEPYSNYSQSVSQNNYYSQNDNYQGFVPEYQRPGQQQSANYQGSFRNDGRRNQRY